MEALKRQFMLPVMPQQQLPKKKAVYPWENTDLFNLCQDLYTLAVKTGYDGTLEEFKTHFGDYLRSDGSTIQYDYYNGQYEVTALPRIEQILRTDNKVLRDDIVIAPIPYYETTNEAGGYTVIIGGN